MAKSDGCDYFKRASLLWMVTVGAAIGYFTCIVFAPEKIPYDYLGFYGTFCKHLVDNYADIMYKGWFAAVAIHVYEAYIALKMCRSKGISNTAARCMWVFQTFVFGFPSLGLLLKYDPERPKQN